VEVSELCGYRRRGFMSDFKVREGVCAGSDFVSRRAIKVARLLCRVGSAGLRRRDVEGLLVK
jgi:hypothetical protein